MWFPVRFRICQIRSIFPLFSGNITSIAVLTRQVSSPACSARLSGQKVYHSPTAMSPYCKIIIPPSKNPSRRFLQSGSLDARIRKSPKYIGKLSVPLFFERKKSFTEPKLNELLYFHANFRILSCKPAANRQNMEFSPKWLKSCVIAINCLARFKQKTYFSI